MLSIRRNDYWTTFHKSAVNHIHQEIEILLRRKRDEDEAEREQHYSIPGLGFSCAPHCLELIYWRLMRG